MTRIEPDMVRALADRLLATADRQAEVVSATCVGSAWDADQTTHVADADFVVIVDEWRQGLLDELRVAFATAAAAGTAPFGLEPLVLTALGPLKFDAPGRLVLHLMVYSRAEHVEHALASPMTCLDWQRSGRHVGQSLAEVFPVFALRPGDFFRARRGVDDYLADLRAGVVSYREVVESAGTIRQERRTRAMTDRDAAEFGYHVLRFVLRNVRKLLRGENTVVNDERTTEEYFESFPVNRQAHATLLAELAGARHGGAVPAMSTVLARAEAFLKDFATQFRGLFETRATRHVLFRHAPTAWNLGRADERYYQGRKDQPILPVDPSAARCVQAAWQTLSPEVVYSSPLGRCRQTLEALGHGEDVTVDDRLVEMAFGECEGLRVGEARGLYPDFFAAMHAGEDPRYPGGGECGRDVLRRVREFVTDRWAVGQPSSIGCTHSVVLRRLLGDLLGVGEPWYRLRAEHLRPYEFIRTPDGRLFVDFDAETARELLSSFDPTRQED